MTIMSSNHQYESMMILRNHWEYGEILLPSPRWSPRCNEHGPSYAGNGARLLPALEAAIPGSLSPHWEWIHMNPDFFGRDESWWNPLNLHLRAILVWAKKNGIPVFDTAVCLFSFSNQESLLFDGCPKLRTGYKRGHHSFCALHCWFQSFFISIPKQPEGLQSLPSFTDHFRIHVSSYIQYIPI